MGDLVLSRDEHDETGEVRARRVLQVFVRVSPVLNLHVGGRIIGTSGEHPFYVVGQGWIPAGALHNGDQLLSHDGQVLPVEGVADSGRVATVYNIEVEENHTYFVGHEQEWGSSVWAHNACVSRIGNDAGLRRHAVDAGRTHQASIDRLTAQLGNGNFNPRIGTRGVFGNVLEARARDGARVYFRPLPNGDAEILAKSSKANQDAVISILQRLYGS